MKNFSAILLSVIFLLGLGFAWLLWEFGAMGNWGFESGYYGQFNRVQHVIEDMPNTQIVDSWKHMDVTLEDFTFTIQVNCGKPIDLQYTENSSQMQERDKSKILQYILQEVAQGE